jgi:hypothetical protein
MNAQTDQGRTDEQGSALVIAILVTAILSLLGISFLLMADTENKIAQNEAWSAQALSFNEGVVREVKRWFDRPPYGAYGGTNLSQPTTGAMDRQHRMIDTDGDGPTAPVAADGSATNPYYKWGVDLDGDGNDDIFDKPYRGGAANTLLGTEAGPDVIISRANGGAQQTLLDALATKIAPSFPSPNGVQARVDEIDVYEPPYINISGTWTRFGMATVKVAVSIYKTAGSTTQTLASRTVKAVLNETPYPGPYGPLQSCAQLNWNGDFHVHWGTSTAVGNINPKGNKLPNSIPRAIPPSPKIDLLYGWQSPAQDATWNTLKANIEANQAIDDPWWRLIAGGTDADYYPGITAQQINAPTTTGPDNSNLFQSMNPLVGCPEFDYQTWKSIAQSGMGDVHYFAWDSGTSFRENGSGASTDFVTLTDQKVGLYFFDTQDGQPPNAGVTNLTPAIQISGGPYLFTGFLYVNMAGWDTKGLSGRPVDFIWPGEPFRDSNQNGVYDAGEGFINLNYNSISTTDRTVSPRGAAADTYGGSVTWNKYGPHITGETASIWGVLYIAGVLDCSGTADYYGSVVTKGGTQDKMTGTPDLWWDPRLLDNWPPPSWGMPRVIITKWQTDL